MSVATVIALQDKASNTLNKVTGGTDRLINRMEQVDSLTNTVNPARNWEQASREVDKATREVEQFDRAQKNAYLGANKVKSAWGGVGTLIKTAISAFGVKKIADFVNSNIGAYNIQARAETQLSTIMGQRMGTTDIRAILDTTSIQQSLGVVGDEIQLMGAQQMATFLNSEDALKSLIPAMNNLAVQQHGVNVTGENMANIGNMIGKVMQGQVGALKRAGISFSEAEERALKYGTEAEKAALLAQIITNNVGNMNEAMRNTPEGKMQAVRNTLGDMREEVGGRLVGAVMALMDSFLNLMKADTTRGFINGIVSGLNLVISAFTWVIDKVNALGNIIQQNWAIIQPILIAAALVLLPMLIAKLWAMVAPIVTSALSFLAMNAPILLVIALIARVLYALNKMGIGFEQVCGFIGGVIGGLYATIYNIIAYLWNHWASFAEFLANVFNHPVYLIKKLFVDLADSVLSLIKSIATAIDKVFGSNLAGGMQSLQSNMRAWLGETPDGYKVIQRMEMKPMADAIKSGYNTGVAVSNKITGALDGIDAIINRGGAAGMALGDIDSIDSIDSVGEVGRIKDDVNIAEEDLRLLRDVAEMRFQQTFVTLTPTVSMSGIQISEKVDIDEVTAAIEKRLEDEFVVAAEGIYG